MEAPETKEFDPQTATPCDIVLRCASRGLSPLDAWYLHHARLKTFYPAKKDFLAKVSTFGTKLWLAYRTGQAIYQDHLYDLLDRQATSGVVSASSKLMARQASQNIDIALRELFPEAFMFSVHHEDE